MPLYRAELLAKKPLRYAALIHDVSQVLYLPFDWDDGSYARDRSGYNNSGTIYGAARVGGKIGMALSHDGVDDYVNIPHSSSINLSDAVTIAVWAKLDRTDIFSVAVCKGSARYQIYYHPAAGKYLFGITRAVTGWKTIAAPAAPGTVWRYIVATYDKNLPSQNMKIYQDAVLGETFDTTEGIATDTNPLRIGEQYEHINPFDGIIDEVRIYNRALSQDEIRMLMYRRW